MRSKGVYFQEELKKWMVGKAMEKWRKMNGSYEEQWQHPNPINRLMGKNMGGLLSSYASAIHMQGKQALC